VLFLKRNIHAYLGAVLTSLFSFDADECMQHVIDGSTMTKKGQKWLLQHCLSTEPLSPIPLPTPAPVLRQPNGLSRYLVFMQCMLAQPDSELRELQFCLHTHLGLPNNHLGKGGVRLLLHSKDDRLFAIATNRVCYCDECRKRCQSIRNKLPFGKLRTRKIPGRRRALRTHYNGAILLRAAVEMDCPETLRKIWTLVVKKRGVLPEQDTPLPFLFGWANARPGYRTCMFRDLKDLRVRSAHRILAAAFLELRPSLQTVILASGIRDGTPYLSDIVKYMPDVKLPTFSDVVSVLNPWPWESVPTRSRYVTARQLICSVLSKNDSTEAVEWMRVMRSEFNWNESNVLWLVTRSTKILDAIGQYIDRKMPQSLQPPAVLLDDVKTLFKALSITMDIFMVCRFYKQGRHTLESTSNDFVAFILSECRNVLHIVPNHYLSSLSSRIPNERDHPECARLWKEIVQDRLDSECGKLCREISTDNTQIHCCGMKCELPLKHSHLTEIVSDD